MDKEYTVRVVLDVDVVAHEPTEAEKEAIKEIGGDKRILTKVEAHSGRDLNHGALEKMRAFVKEQMGRQGENQEPLELILSKIDETESSGLLGYRVEVTLLAEIFAKSKEEALRLIESELSACGRIVLDVTIEEQLSE